MENSNSNTEKDFFLAQWWAGEISDEELRELVGEEDYLTYKELKKGMSLYAVLEEQQVGSFSSIQHKIQTAKQQPDVRKRRRRWLLPVAASFLVLLLAYFYLEDSTVRHSTSFAEMKTIVLPDNSQVILNSKSSLYYSSGAWDKNRAVHLEGEGFFNVKKGSKFKVTTNNGSVEVLGTEFNVKATLDYFEVNCYEGKVSVGIDGQSEVLTKAMSLRKIDGLPIEQDLPAGNSPSWLNGESTFKSVPLVYVIDALERQYGLNFNTEKIDIQAVFTGNFTHENREVALETVFKTMRIHYTISNNNSVALSPYE